MAEGGAPPDGDKHRHLQRGGVRTGDTDPFATLFEVHPCQICPYNLRLFPLIVHPQREQMHIKRKVIQLKVYLV